MTTDDDRTRDVAITPWNGAWVVVAPRREFDTGRLRQRGRRARHDHVRVLTLLLRKPHHAQRWRRPPMPKYLSTI